MMGQNISQKFFVHFPDLLQFLLQQRFIVFYKLRGVFNRFWNKLIFSCIRQFYGPLEVAVKLPQLAQRINDCYMHGEPCVIAANEFPFHKLTNIIKQHHPKLYEELTEIKKNILVLGCPTVELKRVCIVDLNERNLLDKDRCVVKSFIQKFTDLLLP